MQGLYARFQTEVFKAQPVVDGRVPKNAFGNVDLYVPSMLPEGAVHIPFKGVAKIARKLGFDFGEAVTGFEFKKRRAFPIIEGIVIAQEHEPVILEAYWEAEQEAQEKARVKKYDQSVKRWTRLIHGLLIRERLQKQYASRSGTEGNVSTEGAVNERLEITVNTKDAEKLGQGGHHLVGADDVVQRFKLPKDFQVSYPPSKPESIAGPELDDNIASDQVDGESENTGYAFETMDIDDDDHHRPLTLASSSLPEVGPRTLDELAEASRPESPIPTSNPEASQIHAEARPSATFQGSGPTIPVPVGSLATRPNGRQRGVKKGDGLPAGKKPNATHVGSNGRDLSSRSGSSSRKRGRGKEADSDTASDEDEVAEEYDDGAEDEDGDDGDGDFVMGSAVKVPAPAAKRARKGRVTASPAVPPSDRVLRVRKPPTKR